MKVTQKLSTKIFLLMNVTIILTLTIVLSISTYSFVREIQTNVEQQLTLLAKEKAQRFEDALTHFVQLSHTIGNDPLASQFFMDLHQTRSPDMARKQHIQFDLETEYQTHSTVFENIFFSYQGQIYLDGLGGKSVGHDLDEHGAEWYVQTKARQKPYVGQIMQSPITGLPVIVSTYPLLDEHGELLSIFALPLQLTGFSTEIVTSDDDDDIHTLLVDETGRVIMAEDLDKIFTLILPDTNESLRRLHTEMRSRSHGISQFSLEGKEYIGAYRRLEHNVYALTFIGVDRYQAPIRANIIRSLVLLGVFIGLSSLLSLVIAKQISRPILSVVDWVNEMAQGNLIHTLHLVRHDEIGILVESLTSLHTKLQTMTEKIHTAAQHVSTGSDHISSTSHLLSEVASQQAASIEEISSSIEEMTATIHQNTENAILTEQAVAAVANDVEQLGHSFTVTVSALRQVAEKVVIIKEIAERTDLLALNASIEASRAQEAGKGFAVVAMEVKTLAHTSKEAAKTIEDAAQSTVNIALESEALLRTTIPAIQKNAELMAELKAAELEQRQSAEQINRAIQDLSSSSEHSASSAEELASSAEEFSRQAQHLLDIISFFKTTEEQVKTSSLQELLQEFARLKDLMSHISDDNTVEKEIARLFTSEASPQEESSDTSASTGMAIELQKQVDRQDEEFERY